MYMYYDMYVCSNNIMFIYGVKSCMYMYMYICNMYTCRPALVYWKYQLAEYISVNLIELIEVAHSVMYMHVLADCDVGVCCSGTCE